MLKVGKLDSDLLKRSVIDKIKYKRPEVLTKAGIGEDCAVIDFGEAECVMSTDPITAAVGEIGRLAIHISCNDVASNGIEPLGIMLVVLLPVGTTEEDVTLLMEQAAEAAAACHVEIIGGHTEITTAVNKPIIVSTAVGRGRKGQSASAETIQVGDEILLTKVAGLEGTGIIAGDFHEEVKAFLTDAEMQEAAAMLSQVSVVREGVVAGCVGTHGMHDITEGGVLGAIWEMCQIAQVGAEVWQEAIPIAQVTQKICAHYGIDPLRLISSGAMLIMVSPEKKEEMVQRLHAADVPVCAIGRILPADEGLYLCREGKKEKIDPPRTDELYRVVK